MSTFVVNTNILKEYFEENNFSIDVCTLIYHGILLIAKDSPPPERYRLRLQKHLEVDYIYLCDNRYGKYAPSEFGPDDNVNHCLQVRKAGDGVSIDQMY